MSITSCVKKAGTALDAGDKAAIMAAARKYRADGLSADEAGKQAIRDQIAAVQALMDGVPEPTAEVAESAAEPVKAKETRLTDAGEELIRNRRGKLKGLAWDDVSAMNDTLKVAQVVKANVWPRPDYAKMVEDGAPAWKAALLKAVYDKMAAAPVTRAAPTDADLRAYIETMQQVREALTAEIDRVEGLGGAADLWKTLSARNLFGKVFPVPADARPVYGSPSPFDRNSEQGKENNRRALLIGGNNAVRALQFSSNITSKVKDLLADGFPAKQEAWQKSYEVRQTETRDNDVPEAERTGQPQQRFYVYEKGSRWRLAKGGQDGGYATQELAEAFARSLTVKKREVLPPSRGLDLADVKRTGPDWRAGKDVTAQDIIDRFGFRGVNLGEYVKAKQGMAQIHLNHVFDAFSDLADLLGVPPKAMSLNGALGVAIGAQGSGKALAHFVPGVNEINITRDSGAGALAHEFGHAMDHYFATQHGRAASMAKRPYLSATVESMGDPGGVRPEVMAAMRAVMKSLNSRPMTEAEARKYLADQRELNGRRMDRWVKEFSGNKGADPAALSAVAEKIKRGDIGQPQDGDVETNLAEFMRAAGLKPGNAIAANAFTLAYRLRDLADEATFLSSHIPQVDTDYAKASAAMDAKKQGDGYWSTPWEKFARAFETFAMDALKDRQRESLYLSGLVDSASWQSWAVETGKTIPYPAGAERLEMQQAFQKMVETIQTRTDDAGNVAMFDRTGTPSTANHARVTDVAETIAATWANAPEVVVVTDMQDPAVPQKVRDADATQRSQGADGVPAGFFSGGKVYLVSSQISSDEDAAKVLFHEALGHAGLRGVFGSALDKVLDQMAVMRPEPVRAKAKQYGLDFNKLSERRQAAEEVLAELAQDRPTSTWVQRAIAVIKAWLRENVAMFKDLGMSDAEVVSAFLEPARGFIERGRGKAGDTDTMFSRTTGAATAGPARTAQDFVKTSGGVFDFNRMGETKKDRVRSVVDKARPFWLGALTRDQIADIYGDEIPQIKEYDNLTRAMENERSGMAQKAEALYEEWAALPGAVNDVLARMMLDATVAQVHPDRPLPAKATEEQKQAHARLSTAYNALPKGGQAMYAKVRDFHTDTLATLKQALLGRIDRLMANGAEKAAILADITDRFDKYLSNGPYFPLSRFGDFLVVASREDGERVVASYESAGEQQAAARALEKDGFTVKLKTAKTYNRSQDGAAGKFIGEVLTTIDKMDDIGGEESKNQLLDEINQLFIRALPDLSYRKHFMHRKNTPGFSADVMRGFASSAFHAASHIARLNHGDRMTLELEQAFKTIEQAPEGDFNQASQVLNEIAGRHEKMLNPDTHPLSALATQVGFTMYLGMSPAAGLVNMMQVPMVALPYLGARHGFGKAAAAMSKAYTDIMGAKANRHSGFDATQSPKLSADERAAIKTLQEEGVIDLTQAHDLASATARDVGNQARSKASFAMARAMRIVGWTFHVPEVMNRQVTALMAYRLEKAKGASEPVAMNAAREAIKRTQFDYSSSNRARYMQGNIARVVTQFRQFSQNMTYFLGRAAYQALKGESPEVRRIARRQILSTFVITGAMAGSMGLPGLGFFGTLIGALVSAMDDDDEPWDWKVEYRNALADAFGKDIAEVMAKGIPRALMPWWDISSRVSLGDLWWRDNGREGQNPREAWASDMSNILGPSAGTLLGWYTAADHMQRGNYSKGLESVVPKFIRDPLKAYRESREGITSYTGEPLLDTTMTENIGRMFGFAPTRASEMYEGRNAVMNAKTALDQKRQALLSQIAKARIDRDTETEQELRTEIRGFNERNPEFKITGATIVKAVMTRRRNRANREDGIVLPDSKASLREIGRFANIQ